MSTQESTTVSPHSNGSAATVSIVETNRLLPYILAACIFSGLAIGISVVTLYVQATAYHELERENRLVQLKIDEYRMALMNAGIDPNPHLDGESK